MLWFTLCVDISLFCVVMLLFSTFFLYAIAHVVDSQTVSIYTSVLQLYNPNLRVTFLVCLNFTELLVQFITRVRVTFNSKLLVISENRSNLTFKKEI